MASQHDAATLVAEADHESVNEQRLTEVKPSFTTRYLYDDPLIEYLDPDEQPHFILASRGTAIEIEGPQVPPAHTQRGTGMVMHMITDHRWLVVTSNNDGDQMLGVDLDSINGVSITKGGTRSHEIAFSTPKFVVTAPIGNMYDDDEIEAVQSWLIEHTEADSEGLKRSWDPEDLEDDEAEEEPSTDGSEAIADPDKHMDADPQGDWVTSERVQKMGDTLDDDENVHYMWKGGTLDAEGSSSGESIFGNDRDRKTSTKGIYTAVTDKRVVINILQFLGDDERHIPYSSIVTCDLDTGLVARRVSLQTKGPTYHIQAQGVDKDELRTAIRFIRDKAEEADKTIVQQGNSEPDPTEQLKNVKELYDMGALSESEFKEKKQELLDKI